MQFADVISNLGDLVGRVAVLHHRVLQVVHDGGENVCKGECFGALRQPQGKQLAPATLHQLDLRLCAKAVYLIAKVRQGGRFYLWALKTGMFLAQCRERKSSLDALSQL
jgi:hypothetical protein